MYGNLVHNYSGLVSTPLKNEEESVYCSITDLEHWKAIKNDITMSSSQIWLANTTKDTFSVVLLKLKLFFTFSFSYI